MFLIFQLQWNLLKADTSLRRTKNFVPDEFLINSYKKKLSKADTSLKRTLFSGPAGLFPPEFNLIYKADKEEFKQNIKSQYYNNILYQEIDRYVAINQVFFLCWVIISIPKLCKNAILLPYYLKCLWSVKILFIQVREREICTNLMGSRFWSTLFLSKLANLLQGRHLSKADKIFETVSVRFREVPLYFYTNQCIQEMIKAFKVFWKWS